MEKKISCKEKKAKEVEVRWYREAIALCCDKMSMAEIAKRVKVSKGTVYRDLNPKNFCQKNYSIFMKELVSNTLKYKDKENCKDEKKCKNKEKVTQKQAKIALRTIREAVYVVEHGSDLTKAGFQTHVTRSTVNLDFELRDRLPAISPALLEKVDEVRENRRKIHYNKPVVPIGK